MKCASIWQVAGGIASWTGSVEGRGVEMRGAGHLARSLTESTGKGRTAPYRTAPYGSSLLICQAAADDDDLELLT